MSCHILSEAKFYDNFENKFFICATCYLKIIKLLLLFLPLLPNFLLTPNSISFIIAYEKYMGQSIQEWKLGKKVFK